ncbi:hypothetical protein [Risungbinella massiliensis]|nr:hypothetical protein [Risungbinella massiliensis]
MAIISFLESTDPLITVIHGLDFLIIAIIGYALHYVIARKKLSASM